MENNNHRTKHFNAIYQSVYEPNRYIHSIDIEIPVDEYDNPVWDRSTIKEFMCKILHYDFRQLNFITLQPIYIKN